MTKNDRRQLVSYDHNRNKHNVDVYEYACVLELFYSYRWIN
jgi:hypothetical protein